MSRVTATYEKQRDLDRDDARELAWVIAALEAIAAESAAELEIPMRRCSGRP